MRMVRSPTKISRAFWRIHTLPNLTLWVGCFCVMTLERLSKGSIVDGLLQSSEIAAKARKIQDGRVCRGLNQATRVGRKNIDDTSVLWYRAD